MGKQSENKYTKLINKDFSKLDALELSADYLDGVSRLREYNDLIAGYYTKLSEDTSSVMRDLHKRTAENISNCHKLFVSESYPRIRLKDIMSVSLCRNRFCPNCQKLLQDKRVAKFQPIIEKAVKEGLNMYHIVFTVRNVSADKLPLEYAAMQKAFALLVRYMTGNAKLDGSPIPSWGFRAAFRAIEITYNDNGEFHPHYHCVFAFKNDPFGDKTVINKFSYRQGRLDRFFSPNEVLLQKLWRVLVDLSRCKIAYDMRFKEKYYKRHETVPYHKMKPYCGIKLSKKRLAKIADSLDHGFSVIADKLNDRNIYEVFKYAVKFTSEDHRAMGYEQFKVMQETLHNKRCVQCFGEWYGLGEELEELTTDDLTEIYTELRQWWRSLDVPELAVDSPKQLAIDIQREGLRVVWRTKLRKNIDKVATLLHNDGQISIDDLFNL